MRTTLTRCELLAPGSLDEALAMLGDGAGTRRPFAGGTDLMVLLEAGTLPPGEYVNLWGLAELRGVQVTGDCVVLGALTTYTDVLAHPVLRSEFPLICQAAAETGAIAIQNRGTIGGNIANASPAADTPPVLLVYDAELELMSVRGTRRVKYDRFHTGYKRMDLEADELIRSVWLPRGRSAWVQRYRKVGTRRAQAISKICFAGTMDVAGDVARDVRIAFGSVAPTVVRCRAAEDAIRGHYLDESVARRAAEALGHDIAPIDDLRSTARYRMRVAQNLLHDFVSR